MTGPFQIKAFTDPYADTRWEHLAVQPVQTDDNTITLSYPSHHHLDALIEQLKKGYPAHVSHLSRIKTQIARHQPQGLLQPLKKIKNIIAISANKGGVGKSTIAANIAASLARSNLKVGLLDGDLHGPNIPMLMGIKEKGVIKDNQYQPVLAHNVCVISMGLFVDEKMPLVWRGPMTSAYFQQMVFHTNWPDLDYLILDCPPGTGDILLTMAQKVPISGTVLIHTPQCLSISDSIKGIEMLKKMQVPLLGRIENMSSYTCEKCHHKNHIFLPMQQAHIAAQNIEKIGSIPIDQRLVQSTRTGAPHVWQHPSDDLSHQIHQLTTKICAKLACRPLAKANIYSHQKPASSTT